MSVKKWVILNAVKDLDPPATRVLFGNYFRHSL
jgi:hypothetical protein